MAEDVEIILPGCTFTVRSRGEHSRMRGSKLQMTVNSCDPYPNEEHGFYFDTFKTTITISSATSSESGSPPPPIPQIRQDGIGGLDQQISDINQDIAVRMRMARRGHIVPLLGPIGCLLSGLEGTGKTLLLERLAECPWKKVYRITPKTHAKAYTDIFDDALEHEPSLIVIDNVDRLLEKADTLVRSLCTEIQKVRTKEVVIAAAARTLDGMDREFTSAFINRYELFPPDARQREDILRQQLGANHNLDSADFQSLAASTHGFVGRDLATLCGLAHRRRLRMAYKPFVGDQLSTPDKEPEKTCRVNHEDFTAIIDQVHPSLLAGSVLELPKVRWTDVAGLDDVRRRLESIMIFPFKVCLIYARGIHNPVLTHNRSARTSSKNSAVAPHTRVCCCSDPQAVQRP